MTSDALLAAVEGYYTEKVRRHGPTPCGVDWNGADGQEARFEQLLAVIEPDRNAFSLNDYGCGYGALLEPLARRHNQFQYMGYDLSPAMIEEARRRYGDRRYAGFTSERDALRRADYTVASGIFNVKLDAPLDEWDGYVRETIGKMALVSRRGLSFNALTAHADSHLKRADLFYADPAELLDYCLRNFSRDVELRHNYELYEFTVIVRLDARPPAQQS